MFVNLERAGVVNEDVVLGETKVPGISGRADLEALRVLRTNNNAAEFCLIQAVVKLL